MSLNLASGCAVAPMPLSAGGAMPPAPTSSAPNASAPTDMTAAAPTATTDPASIAGASGGGSADLASALAGLQQALAGLSQMLEQLQSGASGAGAGSEAVSGAEGGGAALGETCEHCSGDVTQGPPSKGSTVTGTTEPFAPSEPSASAELTPPVGAAPAQPAPPAAPAGPLPAFDAAPLKVKGADVNPEQRENIKQVLQVGKEMGASRKVLEAAVATVIQESNATLGLDNLDHDSVGLFQQRPSMGWGTVEQCQDPRYAATKFFEKAIPSDKDNPNQAITEIAQGVQRSGFPDAYAQWEGEAKAAVDAFGA